MMTSLTFHPVTEIFPVMEAAAFRALVDDIAAHGQKEPILVLAGQIIDGRHRLQACEQLAIEPWTREVQTAEGDPLSLVISLNLHRRHLSESQRAMVAARLATLVHGQRADYCRDANLHVCDRQDAAQRLSVSPRSVANAAKVRAAGTPELVAAVERGDVAVSTAAELTRLPTDEQKDVLTRSPEDIRAIAQEVKQRIQTAEVAGPSALRVFDQVTQEQGLSGLEQVAVAEVIQAETPRLPTPGEARRIASAGAPGLMVLANDHQYHGAPLSPESALKQERWFRLRDGLEALGSLDFDAEAAIAAVPAYQHANVQQWLAMAVPFLNAFHQHWSQAHA